METSSISILDLPEDVIGVILSKCSAKSVVGLKCVCKQWQSMISDPAFCRAHHLQRRPKNADGDRFMEFEADDLMGLKLPIARFIDIDVIRWEDGEMVREWNFRYEFPRKMWTYPMSYCDGMLMFRAEEEDGDDEYLVLNPSIHKEAVIRGPDGMEGDDLRIFSLYYDEEGGEYKVVRVCKQQQYAVYSCRNMRWGELRDLPCGARASLGWDRSSIGGRFFNLHGDDEVQCFDARGDGRVHTFATPKLDAQGAYLVAISGNLFYVTLQPHTAFFYHQLWRLIMPDTNTTCSNWNCNWNWKLCATALRDKPGPLADKVQYFPFLENLYFPSSNTY